MKINLNIHQKDYIKEMEIKYNIIHKEIEDCIEYGFGFNEIREDIQHFISKINRDLVYIDLVLNKPDEISILNNLFAFSTEQYLNNILNIRRKLKSYRNNILEMLSD